MARHGGFSPMAVIGVLLAWVALLVLCSVFWFTAQHHPTSRVGNRRELSIQQHAPPNQQQQQQQQQQLGHQSVAQVTSSLLGISDGGYGAPAYSIVRVANPDNLTWPGGGFVEVDVRHAIPTADESKYANLSHGSCFDLARQVEQPLDGLYRRRHAPPQDLPGGLPRTFFRWDGNISRKDFDAVPLMLPRGPDCVHCGAAVRYQIVDKHLYRLGQLDLPMHVWIPKVGEDLLLVALHLWDLPDMDFIIHYDDSCPPGYPVLSWNICRDKPKAGFAYPSYTAWMYALGTAQLQVYHQCLATRYPLPSRRPVVYWRGSNTDPYIYKFIIEEVDQVARITIHKRFKQDPVVDAKLSKYVVPRGSDDCVKRYVQPLAPMVQLEDFNQAALIMDVDGNGWSDRLARVVHFPTPTLKQASNHTAFFEHLLAPGRAAEYFANDLSDLKERAYELVAEWNSSHTRLMRQAAQKQGVAAAFMHQVAVAEAAAYALLQYSKKTTWPFVRNTSYVHIPFSKACGGQGSSGAHLPPAFCAEIRARPPHRLSASMSSTSSSSAAMRRGA